MSASTSEILAELIRIRSDVSENQNESELIDWVVRWFAKCPGWTVTRQRVKGNRCNILAKTFGEPEVVVLGHLDTVPVTSSEQLLPRREKEKLFGRGAVDMKAGLAIMLKLARESAPAGLGLVFTVDEEYNFAGIKKLVKDYSWQPQLVINPEPTDLKLVANARGVAEFSITVRGKSVHAARKSEGINAIEVVMNLTQELENWLQKGDKELQSSVNLAGISGGCKNESGEIIVRPNVVPDYVEATVECRLGNTVTRKELEKEVTRIVKTLGGKVQQLRWSFVYQPMTQSEEELRAFTEAISESFPLEWLAGSKAGFYEVQILKELWNCPIVIFGPGPSSQAHQQEEYVDLAELEIAEKVITAYINKQLK